MPWRLLYHPVVKEQDIRALDKSVRERIRKVIEIRLAVAPEHFGEPLRRTLKGYWRLRVGDYRVVFRIAGDAIIILAILHRREV